MNDTGPNTVSGAPAAGAPLGGALSRNVVALGFVSLFTDVSSEMLVPVLPIFVTGVLGASVASLGIIEGIAESTATLLRLGSGVLSDRIGRRKPFLVFGYGISGVAKAAMALAASWPAILGLRFADRVGKGLRNPPRDALIADSVAQDQRGRAYGLHRGMDTLGAAIGPLVAFGMLAMWPGDFRRVFFASAIPAAIAIAVLVLFVHAPRHVASLRSLAQARASLPPAFWRFCIADGAFQLANSSMAFVLLRARDAGIPAASVPLAYAGYNVVYAAAAYPAGQLADRFGRRPLLFAAYGLYAGTYALLAFAHGAPALVAVFALLGIQSALLEVSQRALVSDLAGAEGRATAFGIYYTVAGLALLPASIIAGALWDRFGAEVTFTVDAALALLAALLLLALLPLRGAAQERLDAAR